MLGQIRHEKGMAGELPSAINPPSGCRFRTRWLYAQDICAAEEPPLRPFTAEGHEAACHFPLREPASPRRPAPPQSKDALFG